MADVNRPSEPKVCVNPGCGRAGEVEMDDGEWECGACIRSRLSPSNVALTPGTTPTVSSNENPFKALAKEFLKENPDMTVGDAVYIKTFAMWLDRRTHETFDALDAARYRFLRQPGNAIVYARGPNVWGEGHSGHVKWDTPEALDAAIDAARDSKKALPCGCVKATDSHGKIWCGKHWAERPSLGKGDQRG